MSAIFSHAIRYGWASHNPITAVRTSAKRLREPEILTPEEFQGLLGQLELRESLLVLLAGTTGLRRGELIALRWEDIDFAKEVVNVTHAIWHNVEGETKNSRFAETGSSAATRHLRPNQLARNFALLF